MTTGAILNEDLEVALVKAGVDKGVISALRLAMENSGVEYSASVYAHAMSRSYDEHGVEGVKFQVMYMLLYLRKWSGEEARNAKKILNKWAKTRRAE